MRGINKVILVGTLGKDPKMSYSQNGNAIASFSVATSEVWNDKQTGEKTEKTEWTNVVIFGKLSEIAGQYLTKGSNVYLEGKLQTDKYQHRETGQDVYSTKVNANVMQMLGGGQQGQGQKQAHQQSADYQRPQQGGANNSYSQARNQPAANNFDDDDLVF